MSSIKAGLAIGLVIGISACGGSSSNSAGQQAFAYDAAAEVVLLEGNGEDTALVLNEYSDVDISESDTDYYIDANANVMQITVGHEGAIKNTRVFLSNNPQTLFLQLSGENTELHFTEAGTISNFVQIAGASNRLVVADNSVIEYDEYYSVDNVFTVTGNGHSLTFGQGSSISGITIQLLEANQTAHKVCAPQEWLDRKDEIFIDTTLTATIYSATEDGCAVQ